MNILVTGGAGFIGSNHVRHLLEHADDRVVNLDVLTYAGNLENLAGLEVHPRYRFVKGDIRDAELVSKLLDEESIDAVVHFAAESHVDRSLDAPGAFLVREVLWVKTRAEFERAVLLKTMEMMTPPASEASMSLAEVPSPPMARIVLPAPH